MNARVGDPVWVDRVNVYRLRLQSYSLQEAIQIVTDGSSAREHGFFDPHTEKFVKKWFCYDPAANKANFLSAKKGRISNYSSEQKQEIVSEFLKQNNQHKVSLKTFVRKRQRSDPQFVCKRTFQQWVRDKTINGTNETIKAYSYKVIPFNLSPWVKQWRYNYVAANINRDWEKVAFSDEGTYQTGLTAKYLYRSRFRFYCGKSGKDNIPSIVCYRPGSSPSGQF